jgi:ATP-grasp domain, R2K clade family 2
MMPTLILTPRYTEDSQALWKAAVSLGWQVDRLATWRIPEHLKSLTEPVFYGEALFGPTLAEQLGLNLLNPPEDWLVRLPFEFKRRTITLSTMGEAKMSVIAAFVKPPNDKSFPADIYRGAELPTEYPDEMPVLVSEVVRWEKEFRCFILNRSLRTYSLYARFGVIQRETEFASTHDEDQQMEDFLSLLLADSRVDLPAATVIDVGIIEGIGWACVEQNAAWGAGIYGCNPTAVLEVLQHASTRR